MVQPRLLGERAETGAVEDLDRRCVGDEVTAVLARPGARQAPVVEPIEGAANGGRHITKHLDQVLGVSWGGHWTTLAVPRRSRGHAAEVPVTSHAAVFRHPAGTGFHHPQAPVFGSKRRYPVAVAVIDVAGYVAELKDHAVDHGFHVHDERHFVETYSLRQAWEVDLHPEEGCGGPLDLHLSLEVDPRTLLAFEDTVVDLPEEADPPDEFNFPLTFTWALPPLPSGPDLLRLAIDLAGVGGIDLPLEVSAIDSFASATDAAERRLTVVARQQISLARILGGEELLCEVFDRCLAVSRYLLDAAPAWLGDN
jgi:hypothetical protein